MPMEEASIYILLCTDGSYYTGLTRKDVDERVSEAQQRHLRRIHDCATTRTPRLFLVFRYSDRSDRNGKTHQRLVTCEERSVDSR